MATIIDDVLALEGEVESLLRRAREEARLTESNAKQIAEEKIAEVKAALEERLASFRKEQEAAYTQACAALEERFQHAVRELEKIDSAQIDAEAAAVVRHLLEA